MKMLSAMVAIGLAAGMAAPAMADGHAKMKAEIVERNAKGQATKVKMGDKVYDVCMRDDQDSCINPRAAGLNWGNRPLGHWPGKPASKG